MKNNKQMTVSLAQMDIKHALLILGVNLPL